MSEFDKREDGFERRFAVDEELAFKAVARRNKMLGLWVAELTGRSGEEAQAYAKSLVAAQVGETDPESIFAAIRAALTKAGVDLSDHRIRRKISETMEQARAAVRAGG